MEVIKPEFLAPNGYCTTVRLHGRHAAGYATIAHLPNGG